jgi:deoxycytidine triphosphate deaminase
MILCDSEIRAMLKYEQLFIDPLPQREQFTTTAVDLRLGSTDFKRWNVPSG